MSRAPAVSWLVCSHVVDDRLQSAIASCLAQTFQDFELVFVANGPRHASVGDQVRSWFGHDPRLVVLSTEMRHLTFSLDLGLHHARAPLVARLDGDDVARPGRLAAQVAFMNEHPEVVVLGSAYEIVSPEGHVLQRVEPPLADAAIRAAMLWRNPLCHPAVMFRRAEVLAVGGYLGGIHAQDYDLWLRLSTTPDCVFANLPEAWVGYGAAPAGNARRARTAYAAVAAAQWRQFVAGHGFKWGLAACVTAVKALVRSNPRPG